MSINNNKHDEDECPPELNDGHVCFACGTDIMVDYELWVATSSYMSRFTRFLAAHPNSVSDADSYSPRVAYCDGCAVVCEICDTAISMNDYSFSEISSRYLCNDCWSDNYFHCDGCGYETRNDDANYNGYGSYCETCYEPEEPEDNGPIESYGHTTRATDARFCFREWAVTGIRVHSRVPAKFPAIGFELETNTDDYTKRADAARFMLEGVDGNYMVIKEDGSVSGFEMVTFPADYRAHMELFPWDRLPKLGTDYAMRSWNRGTGCGLHVHISKSAFSSSHIYRFMNFHDHNTYALTQLAGRESDQWARFGKYDYESRLRQAQGRELTDRYVAVNTRPDDSYELRYFRGSLRPDTVKAAIEFTHALWLFTRDLTISDVRNGALLTMDSFIGFARANTDAYPHLMPRLVARGVAS